MMMLLCALLLQAPDTGAGGGAVWTPERVYDTHHHKFSDFESLAAAAARSDVVLFGEQHDHHDTHRMELALLEAVARRRSDVVVSLEMFERDVQPALDQYLAGTLSEGEWLRLARPWSNYQSDYRPLVEFARQHHWRVVAGDVPRRLASAVAHGGLDTLAQLPDSERGWVASELQCAPTGDYFDRFVKAMGDHPDTPGMPTIDNMYRAQCVKDETMAESIARAHGNQSGPLIIQYNGDFHSDFGEGTARRVRRRLPGARVMVLSAIPVPSLDSIDVGRWKKQGDWLVFVLEQGRG